jgi:hypothetical protein
MLLYHVTLSSSVESILEHGLLAERAQLSPRVWLCTRSKIAWAYRHLADVHAWDVGAMCTLTVELPDAWLKSQVAPRRFCHWRRGIFYGKSTIPAQFITLDAELNAGHTFL